MGFNSKIELESRSWCIFENNVAKKTIDKTLINELATGVPRNIVSFFTDKTLQLGEKKTIIIVINGNTIEASLVRRQGNRHRLNLTAIKRQLRFTEKDIGLTSIWFEKDTTTSHFHIFFDSALQATTEQINRTSKQTMTNTRIGQGVFKAKLIEKWDNKCAITSVIEHTPSILIASHTKPWAESNDFQRLDGNNGLLLSPHIDKLFDSHRITFSQNSELIISNSLSDDLLSAWNINRDTQLNLTDMQQYYMDYHRNEFMKNNKVDSI